MEEPKIGFCTNADGIRIAYATFGQGPALVCALDFGFSIKDITQFPIMMRSFEKGSRYHTIVAYDHSGTGLSGRNRTDFTLGASVRDLETVIDHLKLEKVILYGMCGGGPIAMDYAARHPQNITHLVLFNTSAYYGLVTTEAVRSSMVSLYKNRFDFATRGALNLMFPGAGTAFTESLIKMLVDNVTPDTYAQYWEKFSQFDARNILPRIHTPTLVIHRKGYFIPMQAGVELASLIPSARFVPLEEDPFEPARGGYASYERAILEFLGDPVPNGSDDNAGKLTSLTQPVKPEQKAGKSAFLSHLEEPEPGQKKGAWLHLSNPLVYFTVVLLASVAAGIILMLIKC
jgi:pimeloyl-ACP methyl ester carboxylesterase